MRADIIIPTHSEATFGLERLVPSLREAWSAETSSDAGWSAENISLGQCAVTALVVQDMFGGRLLRAMVNGVSHYWNQLPDGEVVDLTRDQFELPLVEEEIAVRERDYVLSFPVTVERYELLKARLTGLL